MQYLGLGLTHVEALLGFLGMRSRLGSWQAWKAVEARLGVGEEAVTIEMMAKNLAEEMGLSPECPDTLKKLCAFCYDMGWQQRSSGHKYDSPSGHALLIGARTKKICGMIVLAKCCATCDSAERKMKTVKKHRCFRNCKGSSKGMEAAGCPQLVETLSATNENLIIAILIGDDDSTMKAVVSHSYKDKCESEAFDFTRKDNWPRQPSGGFKADRGLLGWLTRSIGRSVMLGASSSCYTERILTRLRSAIAYG
jgi:hypothetical protein